MEQERLGSKSLLLFATFALSLVSLGAELTTIRALAPIIGTSSLVTANVIGTVILALSFGYYLSSLYDAVSKRVVNSIFILTALSLFLAPILLWGLQEALQLNQLNVEFVIYHVSVSFVAGLIIGGLPSVGVGFLSPIIFERLNTFYGSVKITAARSFCFGAIGSLAGSLAPNLLLIPVFGVKATFFIMGNLVLLTLALFVIRGRTAMFIATACFLVACYLGPSLGQLVNRDSSFNSTHVYDTRYQTVKLTENNGVREMRYNATFGIQSVYDPESNLLKAQKDDETVYWAIPVVLLNREFEQAPKIIIIGSAGGTTSSYMSKYFGERFPEMRISNIEIDGKVNELAVDYFHTEFIAADGRGYLDWNKTRFDLIISDAYKDGSSIPGELISDEFFKLASERLTEQGVFAANVLGFGVGSHVTRVAIGGLQRHFKYVYARPDFPEGGKGFQTTFLFASQTAINFSAFENNLPSQDLLITASSLTSKAHLAAAETSYAKDDDVSGEYIMIKSIIEQI